MSPTEMLSAFHEALGDEPGRGNAALRLTLHKEEHEELLDELSDKRLGIDVREPKADEDVDRAQLARELADVVYVAYGTAHAFGIDLEGALAEVHRAAMDKLYPPCQACNGRGRLLTDRFVPEGEDCPRCDGSGEGERVLREDGKIMKPPGFVPPDMTAVIR